MTKWTKKRQKKSTDVGETECCPSAVVQRAARRKNSLHEWSAVGNWDPQEGQQ